jgi:hypothetical protein
VTAHLFERKYVFEIHEVLDDNYCCNVLENKIKYEVDATYYTED